MTDSEPRGLPNLDRGSIKPFEFPDRPVGSPQRDLEELKRRVAKEPLIIPEEAPRGPIRQDAEGDIIDANDEYLAAREQEKEAVAKEVPEEEQVRIRELVERTIKDPAQDENRVKAIRGIEDLTVRQFGLDELAHALSVREHTNNGTAGNFNSKKIRQEEAKYYRRLKPLVFKTRPS